MAELAPKERLQPSLLDRLTDDEPDRKTESREKRALSPRRFQAAVLRDLGWLLNARAHPDVPPQNLERPDLYPMPFDRYPLAAKSVINFGLPDATGTTTSSVPRESMERLISEAIQRFEPRLMRNSIVVRGIERASDRSSPHVYDFEISADLWADPIPTQLYIKTEVDLETGECVVRDRARG